MTDIDGGDLREWVDWLDEVPVGGEAVRETGSGTPLYVMGPDRQSVWVNPLIYGDDWWLGWSGGMWRMSIRYVWGDAGNGIDGALYAKDTRNKAESRLCRFMGWDIGRIDVQIRVCLSRSEYCDFLGSQAIVWQPIMRRPVSRVVSSDGTVPLKSLSKAEKRGVVKPQAFTSMDVPWTKISPRKRK